MTRPETHHMTRPETGMRPEMPEMPETEDAGDAGETGERRDETGAAAHDACPGVASHESNICFNRLFSAGHPWS